MFYRACCYRSHLDGDEIERMELVQVKEQVIEKSVQLLLNALNELSEGTDDSELVMIPFSVEKVERAEFMINTAVDLLKMIRGDAHADN